MEMDATGELTRLRRAMAEERLSAVLVTEPGSICYVSGYAPPVPIGAGTAFAGGPNLAVVGTAASALLVSGAEASQARRELRGGALIVYPSFGHFDPLDARAEFLGALEGMLRQALPAQSDARLGIEPRSLPALVASLLAERFPRVALVDATAAIAAARMIKTTREIALLRTAAAAADGAQETLRGVAHPGTNELALWRALCGSLEAAAGAPVAISGELISGPRTAAVDYPGGPRDRTLELGDTIICDISPCIGGYYADCCNTLVVGEPSGEQRRYFTAAVDAWSAAVEALRPGNRACDAAIAAEAAFAGHGLPMAHYTGHSIGASVNELPRLVHYDRTPLAAGMVFAVEPGAYAGAGGTTGARTEKMVLITEQGPEVLSRFRWGLDR